MPFVLLLLVVALHLWLVWVGSLPGDRWALHQGFTPHPAWVRDYASFFQHLGTPPVAVPLAVIALIALLRYGSRREAAGLVVACLAVPLNAILKLTLGPSPLWRTAHAGHDYPSGHTTFVVAVLGYLCVLAWRYDRRRLAAVAALLIIGVGPARVVTGIHLVSDVIGGYLLGATMLLLALRVAADAPRGHRSGRGPSPRGRRRRGRHRRRRPSRMVTVPRSPL